ncbi:hypothetical protein AVEN_745-1 [Araneus ventricosus]|uniref:Uncharacterized protein n=1 Tax=Araneus ventricosus TaxID=182803 RepID=A0A4Y2AVN2_ARAVE|nr:hypothetical protein AVEN_745-1 [Araneus ventricosus]
MECRFPAILVFWLGREFYKDVQKNSGGMKPLTSDLGDKLGCHFRDLVTKCRISKIVEFSRYLYQGPRSGFLQMIPYDLTTCRGDYKWRVLGSRVCVNRLGSTLECERLGNLSMKSYPQCKLVSC